MKILMVAPQPFFTPRGTPFSVYYRTWVACELGHDVDLLTYGQGSKVQIPHCRIIRIPAFHWLGPVAVGPSLRKLFLDCFMIGWTVGLLLRKRYDVVHAHEEAVFWCRWLKPLFKFQLVYDMHSSLPQQLLNFRFTRSRTIYWLFEKLEGSAVRAADAVITICPALRDLARKLADGEKVVLIENSLFDPVQFVGKNPVPDRLGDPPETERIRAVEQWLLSRDPEKVIAYAGTLEVYQGIDLLLEAFSKVAKQMPGSGLLIVGGTPREVEDFRGLADQLGLGNAVHFTGQLPQPEAHRLVGIAGVAISPRVSGNNSPMKIYQLMAIGIPVVATCIESHTQILNKDIAILSDVNAGDLADAMIHALSDREGARAIGRRAQEWYREHYSKDVYTSKMLKLLSLVA
jgi:glycosyltransferase involved in cell wall biosynthesis